MKKTILLVFLVCTSFVSFSQNNAVRMIIKNVIIHTDTIVIAVEIKNDSTVGLTISKPDLDFVCCNISRIYFEDVLNGEKFECSPCTDITDLEAIILNYKNSIYLEPQESLITHLKIGKDDTRFLRLGRHYNMYMYYDLHDVNIESDLNFLYKGRIDSNKYLIKYK